jgi:hypothetical protein
MKKEARRRARKPFTGVLSESPPPQLLLLYFGLDPSCPDPNFKGSAQQWASMINGARDVACRHMRACFAALAEHYNLDLKAPDAAWTLVHALAIDLGVPALQLANNPPRNGRPTELDPWDLLSDWTQLREREKSAGRKRPSDRTIAHELAKKDWAKKAKVGEHAICKALLQATRAVDDGQRKTEFQRQFIDMLRLSGRL